MSKKNQKPRSQRGRGRERHISVRSVRREEPDVRKLARAVIALAMAQAEADARAQRENPDGESDQRDSDER